VVKKKRKKYVFFSNLMKDAKRIKKKKISERPMIRIKKIIVPKHINEIWNNLIGKSPQDLK